MNKIISAKNNRTLALLLAAALVSALILAACSGGKPTVSTGTNPDNQTLPNSGASSANANEAAPAGNIALAAQPEPTARFTLVTGFGDGKLVFTGKGGDIDGKFNPDLQVDVGEVVEITLEDGDGGLHDFAIPDLGVKTGQVNSTGATQKVVFTAEMEGTYAYYCTITGHRQAGMEGKLVVGSGTMAMEHNTASTDQAEAQVSSSSETQAESSELPPAAPATAESIGRDPSDLPGPLGARGPETVRFDIETIEVEGQLADGATYTYWTFDGKVPGPFLRVRVGDTVEVNLINSPESTMVHSIDLHAVTGPGGGAAVTQVQPGEQKSFTFQPLNPGLYVYHCATPMVAHHIASGMFGLILVEPEGGLPPVDHEYYVMQSEIYTENPLHSQGAQQISIEKLMDESPEYFVLNGAVGTLTAGFPLHANTGETVRIFFGVGGPNFTSAFHVIGEIFDRVYDQASLTAAPLTDVQTTLVPPGGATMVEFAVEVPGRYLLVDHAISRLERGLVGFLVVEGAENPDVFHSETPPDGSH